MISFGLVRSFAHVVVRSASSHCFTALVDQHPPNSQRIVLHLSLSSFELSVDLFPLRCSWRDEAGLQFCHCHVLRMNQLQTKCKCEPTQGGHSSIVMRPTVSGKTLAKLTHSAVWDIGWANLPDKVPDKAGPAWGQARSIRMRPCKPAVAAWVWQALLGRALLCWMPEPLCKLILKKSGQGDPN